MGRGLPLQLQLLFHPLPKRNGGGEVQSKRHRRRINAAVSRGRAGLKEGSGQNGAVLGSAPSPSSSSSERPSGPAIFGRGEDLDNSSVQNQDGKTMSRGYDCISHSPVELDIGIQQLHQSHKDRSAAKIDARAICPLEVREVTFAAWPSILLRQLFASRTPFSFFLRQCILMCRGSRDEASTALFPLPFPLGDVWCRGPEHLGVSQRSRLAVRRSLYLAIAALNFVHFQCPLKVIPGLWRCPGPLHAAVHARLIALIKASGPAGKFSFLNCGRKAHQLDARLKELHEALQSLGFDEGSFYKRQHEGAEVKPRNDKDELRPYRPLDASRLKLSGKGSWDCREHLSDLLYMPFVEPRSNQYDVVPPAAVLPDMSKVSVEETLRLCKVWDAQGLLRLFPCALGPMHSWCCTKVFNNFKSAQVDRQIGDRRGQNFTEGRIEDGPSHSLPTAASLLCHLP